MASEQQERRRFWRIEQGGGTEVLDADFRTHTYSRHVHDRYVFGVVTRGAETFYYRGGHHVVAAGELVILNPDEVHDGMAATRDGWAYSMSYLPPEALRLEDDAGQPYFRQPVVDDPELAAQYFRSHAGITDDGASRLTRDSLFLKAVSALVARHAAGPRPPRRRGLETAAVSRVRDYLDAHYADNVALDTLAALAGLTPLYLIRVFRNTVGLPPHAYHMQRRILGAARHLRAGTPIAQVAADCGFADQSHLTRHFKRMVGVTPGEFRAGSFKRGT